MIVLRLFLSKMGATHISVKMLVIFLSFLVLRLDTSVAEIRRSTSDSKYEWKPYPREMYPHFRRAYLNMASSDSKIAIYFHSLNLNVTDGVYHHVEPDYSLPTTDGHFNLAALPTVESVDETAVTDQPADESDEESLYSTVTDQSADESLYSTVTDQSADESLYSTVTDQSADESLYSTVTDQSADESLYSTVTDQSADDNHDQSFPNMIEDRLGLLFEELQELLPDRISPPTETVEKAPKPSSETVEKALDSSSDEKPPLQAGSIRGIPGVHFPDYYDIPITSFTCADKKYIPGFYADLETGCQIFHVCWPHRRESFLCPVGTTFNQAILTCDYWYSTNCSLAPLYFDVNARGSETETSTAYTSTMIDDLIKSTRAEKPVTSPSIAPAPTTAKPVVHMSEQPSPDTTPLPAIDWTRIFKFLPVRSKVVIYPESTGSKMTIKHSSLKPHYKQESGEVKLDAKEKLSAQIIDMILKAVAQRSTPVIESATELVSPKKKQQQAAQASQIKPIEKLIPLPTINKQFVVQPLLVIKTTEEEKRKLAALSAAKSSIRRAQLTPMQPATILKPKTSIKIKDENVPEIVMRALEAAGSALQRDILPFTRKIVDSSVNVHKAKKM